MSPECLKIAATVWRAAVGASARLEGNRRSVSNTAPRPSPTKTLKSKTQYLGVAILANCKDRSTWCQRVTTKARAAEKRSTATEEHRKRASQSCSTTHSCLMGSDWPYYQSLDPPPLVVSLKLWSSSTFKRGTTLFSFWLFSLFVMTNRLTI